MRNSFSPTEECLSAKQKQASKFEERPAKKTSSPSQTESQLSLSQDECNLVQLYQASVFRDRQI